jgi:uncharacterized lipoprotein YbaY/heat shock protein HslJ
MRFAVVLSLFSMLVFSPLGPGSGGAARAEGAAVTGRVIYLDRAMLPPGAVLDVQLQDISRADAPAEVLSALRVESLGAPPYPFALPYDPGALREGHTYAVSARITHGDRLVMISDTIHPVLTRGAPSEGVEVIVRRVSTSADAMDASPQVMTAPGLRLPATFTGTIPMASGPGTEWHLDLWPDQVFHLSQSFGNEGERVADIGLWSADPARDAIVLRGGREAPVFLQVRGNGDLRLMTPDGEPIESDLPYTLTAGPLDPAEVALPMGGMFRYMADAALFQECLTGRNYPVAMEGAYIDAERAYLALDGIEPGAPVFAVLEGQLAMRTPMEGNDRMHLVIDRFSRFVPGETCERNRATASLTNTYWRLLEIAGTPVGPFEGAREPFLVLREGDEPSFNASVGCNMMRGGYEAAGDTLDFGPAAMTMMACPPPLDTRERALGAALEAVARWQVNGNTLELFDAEGSVVLLGEAVYLP